MASHISCAPPPASTINKLKESEQFSRIMNYIISGFFSASAVLFVYMLFHFMRRLKFVVPRVNIHSFDAFRPAIEVVQERQQASALIKRQRVKRLRKAYHTARKEAAQADKLWHDDVVTDQQRLRARSENEPELPPPEEDDQLSSDEETWCLQPSPAVAVDIVQEEQAPAANQRLIAAEGKAQVVVEALRALEEAEKEALEAEMYAGLSRKRHYRFKNRFDMIHSEFDVAGCMKPFLPKWIWSNWFYDSGPSYLRTKSGRLLVRTLLILSILFAGLRLWFPLLEVFGFPHWETNLSSF